MRVEGWGEHLPQLCLGVVADDGVALDEPHLLGCDAEVVDRLPQVVEPEEGEADASGLLDLRP